MPPGITLEPATTTNLQRDDHGRWRLARSPAGHVPQGQWQSLPVDLGSTAPHPIRIEALTQWTAPLRWAKHPGNPIYGPHLSGPWDTWTNGVSIVPTPDNRSYHMYYAGTKGEGIGFAQAGVEDPLTWREHPSSPVLRPRTDNWEGNLINQPRVVKVTDTYWRMYYTGWGFEGPGTKWALGLAESFDAGITWKRHGDQPILDRGGPDSPDGAGACVPSLLHVNGRWLMWYTAGQINAQGHQNIHLCLAMSDDGLHWEKHAGNPVLTDNFADGAARSVTSRCCVRHDGGVFRMWYSFAKPDYRIQYAESLDGVAWERAPVAPVLGPSAAPAWDDTMVEYPEVQIHDGQYRLWFCGNAYGSVGFARGVVQTGVKWWMRTGDRADDSAAEWREIHAATQVDVRRFVQVRAELWSTNAALSPALNEVKVAVVRG